MKRFGEGFQGFIGEAALREAKAGAFSDILSLLYNAARKQFGESFEGADEVYADRIIVCSGGRFYQVAYAIDDSNQVQFGATEEVVRDHVPVAARMTEAVDQGGVFIEAKAAEEGSPPRYLVRVIRAGMSGNNVNYPAAVLREATQLFNGARVFAKSDAEHIEGKGKDARQLLGKLSNAKYVESNGGEIQATLDVLESHPFAAQLREAVGRDMHDLFGLSIDAVGTDQRRGKYREAKTIDRVLSVDLIVEPGAGGAVIRFTEAKHNRSEDMLRDKMLAAIRQKDAGRAEQLASANDEEILVAYREAMVEPAAPGAAGAIDAIEKDMRERVRMIEARSYAASAIAGSTLPDPAKARLQNEFRERATFVEADVDARIKGEGEYLARFVESGHIAGLGGGSIEAGLDVAEKRRGMLDAFFDRSKRSMSFRECYAEITGDRDVTGLLANCDARRLRESAAGFREAISSTTFADILGDSVARAMIREYGALESYQDWRWLVDVVPVRDFRTQERTRLGGYGNLPTVAENGSYAALTTPGDEKATYALAKKGGTETVSLETIAGDDVGLIRRIPQALAVSAARTLYEFVYDFLATNPTVYDSVALFHATHNNLGTAALDATSFAAARLAMRQQTELSSAKPLGLTLRHVAVPNELEEAAFNMFVRNTNNDETFVQSRKPTVHVVDYWTDANNWFGTADNSQVPLIEVGFYAGREDPEIFIQDNPTQGSLFSNDQLKWKIRHVYSGAVRDFRGFYGAVVA